ncbi:MAG: hypothetical protein RIT04_104 [Candidatus Parcubacteria bacterium]|jgi:hypothetical protein
MLKTSNILFHFSFIFCIEFLVSFLLYWIFSFEIAIIFAVSFGFAVVSLGFAGLENILILIKEEESKNTPSK